MRRPIPTAAALLCLYFANAGAADVLVAQGTPPPPPPPPPPLSSPLAPAGPVRPTSFGSSSVSGVVLSADQTAAPIRRARVTLAVIDETRSIIAVTDDEGRFVVDRLPASRVALTATKAGYIRAPYGAESYRGQPLPIVLAEGQAMSGVTIRMARGGVITGRITDASGTPLMGAVVQIGEPRVVDGQTTLVGASATGLNQTDDRGMYRVYGLPPGQYVVGVSPSIGGRPAARLTTEAVVRWATGPRSSDPPPATASVVYSNVFYPGTTDPSAAATITLGPGEERTGVDVTMQWTPTASVSGRITRADGQPVNPAQVHAISDTATSVQGFGLLSLGLLRPTVSADTFTLTGLVPGTYTLMARGSSQPPGPRPTLPAPGAPAVRGPIVNDLWAETKVTVAGSDLTDVSLVLHAGMILSGRVRFESTTVAPPDPARVMVNLTAPPTTGVSIGVPPTQTQADGSFRISGVAPGRYLVSASAPGTTGFSPAWRIKSATVGNRDVLDTPLEIQPQQDVSDIVITFTDRMTELSGRILDSADRPVAQYYVGVFPTDQRQWRRGSRWLRAPVRPSSDGQFRLAGLPAGDYYLAALPEVEPNEWFSPGFLEQIAPGAIRVTVAEGAKTIQDVRLAAR